MPKFGPMEIGIILIIILIIFGVGRLPQVGASLGKTIRAFKQGQSPEAKEEVEEAEEEPEEKPRRKKNTGTTLVKKKTGGRQKP